MRLGVTLYQLDYFYYRVLIWWAAQRSAARRKGRDTFWGDEAPAVIVGMCIWVNALTLLFLFSDLANLGLSEFYGSRRQVVRPIAGLVALILVGAIYWRYSSVTLRDWEYYGFTDESVEQSRVRGRICVAYVVLTFLIPPMLTSLQTTQ